MTANIPIAPGRWPLLGHTPGLLAQRFGFTDALREHGEVVKIYLGWLPTYFIASPELVHQMLVAAGGKFEKGVLFDRFRPYFGNGLAMSNGDFHRRQRRLMQPAFHRDQIARHAETMVRTATRLVDSWRPGQVVRVDEVMPELTVTLIGETLFGTELGRAAIAEAQRSMPIVIKQGMVRALSPAFLERLPVPANRRFDEAIARLRRIVHEVIAAGRADGRDRGDLLSMLLLARDEETGEGMSDDQIHDEVVTLLTGGIETTALALDWFWYEIGRHPEVEQRFHAEIDRQIGDRPVSFADLPALDYTRRVINEVLRKYPVWLLMRRTREEVDLGGYRIPAGAEVAFSPHALHHDPRSFPDPDRFDPDRWLPDHATVPRGAFVPFGAGARLCIGNVFAQAEIAIVAATVARRWRLVPVAGERVRVKVTGAAYPSRLPMTVVPRHG